MDWHAKAGYAVLALVIFRLLWGVVGSDTARFSRFVAPPLIAISHLKHALRREPDRQVGHNPAGAWMVLLLLALLLGETLSGLYVANDVADQGPLTELVPAPIANAITALHWIFWDALLAADRAAYSRDRDLRHRQGARPAHADDHRTKAPAGGRSAPAYRQPRTRKPSPRRQRARCRRPRQRAVSGVSLQISFSAASPDRGSRRPDERRCGR